MAPSLFPECLCENPGKISLTYLQLCIQRGASTAMELTSLQPFLSPAEQRLANQVTTGVYALCGALSLFGIFWDVERCQVNVPAAELKLGQCFSVFRELEYVRDTATGVVNRWLSQSSENKPKRLDRTLSTLQETTLQTLIVLREDVESIIMDGRFASLERTEKEKHSGPLELERLRIYHSGTLPQLPIPLPSVTLPTEHSFSSLRAEPPSPSDQFGNSPYSRRKQNHSSTVSWSGATYAGSDTSSYSKLPDVSKPTSAKHVSNRLSAHAESRERRRSPSPANAKSDKSEIGMGSSNPRGHYTESESSDCSRPIMTPAESLASFPHDDENDEASELEIRSRRPHHQRPRTPQPSVPANILRFFTLRDDKVEEMPLAQSRIQTLLNNNVDTDNVLDTIAALSVPEQKRILDEIRLLSGELLFVRTTHSASATDPKSAVQVRATNFILRVPNLVAVRETVSI